MNHINLDKKIISKTILKSQHCQRNFDLNQAFPEEDVLLLKTAVSQCPSRQNIAFYKVHFVFDREIIEKIYHCTHGRKIEPSGIGRKNPQVLGNLLVVFEESNIQSSEQNKNFEIKMLSEGKADEAIEKTLDKDRKLAVGIAAGYLNLTASLLGYKTGCCTCFDGPKIKSILNLKRLPFLLMGIGFRDNKRLRTEHQLQKGFFIRSCKKQPIEVNFLRNQKRA